MIKVSNIILIGTLIATVATAGPKAMQCIELNHSIKTAEASITDTNSKLLKVDDKLKHAKDKCVDIQISSNYEVAKTIAGFKGCKIKSIASLIMQDGEPFECSEVLAPEDVNFFNDAIEKIRYTLSVSDPKKFIHALNLSAISVDSLSYDSNERIATLTVASISSAVSQPTKEYVEGEEQR